jgi:hypothetical protein
MERRAKGEEWLDIFCQLVHSLCLSSFLNPTSSSLTAPPTRPCPATLRSRIYPCARIPYTSVLYARTRTGSFLLGICAEILKGNKTALLPELQHSFEGHSTQCQGKETMLSSSMEKDITATLIFNEAKVSDEERSRLYVRTLGYCNSELFNRMTSDPDHEKLPVLVPLNEDNPINDAAKFRKKPHSRTPSSISMGRPFWFRVYVDGYGGGNSMSAESYESAIGGYLFVCSSTGDMHNKLYAFHEQFPAAVFQFLTDVESEGYRYHELYCDTFSVDLSAELEEVGAMVQTKIVPVSAGTPQEVSFVETAHRVVAARSRAMMLGAPHLPAWCWALSDKHLYTSADCSPRAHAIGNQLIT